MTVITGTMQSSMHLIPGGPGKDSVSVMVRAGHSSGNYTGSRLRVTSDGSYCH